MIHAATFNGKFNIYFKDLLEILPSLLSDFFGKGQKEWKGEMIIKYYQKITKIKCNH